MEDTTTFTIIRGELNLRRGRCGAAGAGGAATSKNLLLITNQLVIRSS